MGKNLCLFYFCGLKIVKIMFKSRRKKAILLLTKRKNEIVKISNLTTYDKWLVRTNAIVKQYIGENEFHRQKFAKVNLTIMPKFSDNEKKAKWINAQKLLAKEYMDSCIEFLNNEGQLAVQPNWFSSLDKGTQLAIILFAIPILWGGGMLTQNYLISEPTRRMDVKELNDKIDKLTKENECLRAFITTTMQDSTNGQSQTPTKNPCQ